MFKPSKLILLIFCVAPLLGFAQDDEYYTASTEKKNEIQAGGGLTGLGFYLDLDYGRQVTGKLLVKASIALEMAKSKELSFTTYFLKPGILYTLNRPEQKVHINAAVGLVGMYASFADSKEITSDIKSKGMNIGGYIGPELDVQISPAIALNAHFHQAYLPMEFMGSSMYFVGAGLKFKF